MSANFFDAGYDLLVVASAYTTIDPADWAVIEDAVATRKVRGVVLYIDSVNATNRLLIPNLISASMGVTVGVGSAFGSGSHYFPLNTDADAQSYFSALPRMELNTGFSVYSGVPSHLALYGGVAGAATDGTVSLTDPTTSAAAVFVTHAESFSGAGACVFGIPDIGWGASPTGHNTGKLGEAFFSVFNDATGPCAAALASPPVLRIEKTTTANPAIAPVNGSVVPYAVAVSNTGTSTALNIVVTDPAPAGMTFGTWHCVVQTPGNPAAVCPTGLPTSGDLNAVISALPAGAELLFTVDATILDNTQNLTNTATLTLPAGATCDGGASPCLSQVMLPSAGSGSATGTVTPVPTLSHAMLVLLAGMMAYLGMRRTLSRESNLA
ncbi:IPTL-CTERM sorting domain-containing protein [Lampropedia puyangensis]|nr:IPTL-CTERM sorting domain-containing protein [Lampropedia puyangensis]